MIQIMKRNRYGHYFTSCACIVCACVLMFTNFVWADSDNSSENLLPKDLPQTVQQSDETPQLLRVSSSDTSGLHSIVLNLIGDYNPVVTDHVYYTTSYNGTQVANHNIEIEPDWSWIISACLFIVVIYSVFRFLGGLFSGGKI